MQHKISVDIKGFVAFKPIRVNRSLTTIGVGVHIEDGQTQHIKAMVFGERAKAAMDIEKGETVRLEGEMELMTKRKRDGKGLTANLTVRTFNISPCERTEPHFLRSAVGGIVEARAQMSRTREDYRVSNFDIIVSRSGKRWRNKTKIAATAFGRKAVACGAHLYRGRRVLAEGDIRLKTWTDRAGCRQAALALIAKDVKLLEHRRGGRRPARVAA